MKSKGGENIYYYILKYEHENELYQLPVPPEKMVTNYFETSKKYEMVNQSEINILKDTSLREISMKILLPYDITMPFVSPLYTPEAMLKSPDFYLSKFGEFKKSKKPIQLLITRILPNGNEIFKGNLLVSLEKFTVYEMAGEEGDFTVDLLFREYRYIPKNEIVPKKDGTFTKKITRATKEIPRTYTVKAGDTLWHIAKMQLNDETKYKEIMVLNHIEDPKKLKIGTILNLNV